MSDYTPTTDEVRDAWAQEHSLGETEACAEFDRWLAAHDAELISKANASMLVEEGRHYILYVPRVTTFVEANAIAEAFRNRYKHLADISFTVVNDAITVAECPHHG